MREETLRVDLRFKQIKDERDTELQNLRDEMNNKLQSLKDNINGWFISLIIYIFILMYYFYQVGKTLLKHYFTLGVATITTRFL